jgi:hypothetical protein
MFHGTFIPCQLDLRKLKSMAAIIFACLSHFINFRLAVLRRANIFIPYPSALLHLI